MSEQHESWAFFDFDDTLVKGDSIIYWRKYLYKKKPFLRIFQIVDLGALLLHTLRVIDVPTFKRILFMPVCYVRSQELNRLAEDFVREELVPRMYSDVVNLAFAHHKMGHGVIIISASSLFYLKFLSAYLPPCKILGTEWELPGKGLFRIPQYPQNQGNLKGENKIIYIRSRPDLPSSGKYCFAYSDNIVDRFLLNFCEFPSVVHPDKLLLKLAEDNHWPILRPDTAAPKFVTNLKKIGGLILVLPTRPPKNSKILELKKTWKQEDYFPLNWLTQIKERVNILYPESAHKELHQKLFKRKT